MNETVLTTLAVSGFVVAFFHAAIPTHWLPFVLTSRVQRWSGAKTLGVTALAGTGHVLITALLGVGITVFGTLNKSIGEWFARIAAAALLLFALYYLVRQLRGKGHVHFDYPHEHLHRAGAIDSLPHQVSDRAAILSLLAFLTFSPCEAFLPIYGLGIRYGWLGFAVLTAILSIGAVLGMVVFTALTLAGLSQIKLGWLEKYESGIMAVLLGTIGVLVLLFES